MARAQQANALMLEQELGKSAQEQTVSILLVDDRQENLLALEATLGYLDQNIVKATSGREAVEDDITC